MTEVCATDMILKVVLFVLFILYLSVVPSACQKFQNLSIKIAEVAFQCIKYCLPNLHKQSLLLLVVIFFVIRTDYGHIVHSTLLLN